MCNEYNGWSNYETWVFNLWHDDSFAEDAQQIFDEAEPAYKWQTKRDASVSDLEDYIRQFAEDEYLPEPASFMSDLVGAAINKINFREIAIHYIDNIEEKTDEECEDV